METADTTAITGGPLKAHEYILVKSEMDAGDERWIHNHAAKQKKSGNDTEMVITIGDIQFATLQRMVRGWNVSKRKVRSDGTVVDEEIPYGTQYIERLPRSIYRYALKKLDEMNPNDEEAETDEDFLTGVTDSSGISLQKGKVVHLSH